MENENKALKLTLMRYVEYHYIKPQILRTYPSNPTQFLVTLALIHYRWHTVPQLRHVACGLLARSYQSTTV